MSEQNVLVYNNLKWDKRSDDAGSDQCTGGGLPEQAVVMSQSPGRAEVHMVAWPGVEGSCRHQNLPQFSSENGRWHITFIKAGEKLQLGRQASTGLLDIAHGSQSSWDARPQLGCESLPMAHSYPQLDIIESWSGPRIRLNNSRCSSGAYSAEEQPNEVYDSKKGKYLRLVVVEWVAGGPTMSQ